MKAIEITTSSHYFYTVSVDSQHNDGWKTLLQGHRPTKLGMNSNSQVAGADATCCSFPKRLPPLLRPYFKPSFARLEKGKGFSPSVVVYIFIYVFMFIVYHVLLLEILPQLNIGPAPM